MLSHDKSGSMLFQRLRRVSVFLFSNFFFSSNLHDHIYTASVILLVSISTVILLAQIYYEKSHGGVLLVKIHCDTAALLLLVNAKTRSDLRSC